MKKYVIVSLLISFSFAAMAQTVALHRNGETQIFKGINAFVDANNAAQDGDTLYLSGHNFTAPASFDKSLKIYGVGHLEEVTTATGKTYVNGNFALKQGADNFLIEGIDFGNLSVENNKSVKNLTVKRCNIRGAMTFSGIENPTEDVVMSGNILRGNINLQNTVRTLLNNNIIIGQIANTRENIFKNNVFLSHIGDHTIVGSDNMMLNNYFVKTYGSYRYRICNGNGNIFYNNVFSYPTPDFGTNYIIDNNWFEISMQDFFVHKEGEAYDLEDNLHLKNPEIYIGEDGTQVGIYGGMYPYKVGAIPVIPYIESVDIPHKVDENGNLPVKITIKAQNEQD